MSAVEIYIIHFKLGEEIMEKLLNKKSLGYLLFILVLFSFSGLGEQSFCQQLAFPTAEGYGKYATGGRGGKVIEVTNLNSSGTGSFAAAIAQSGARTVVFTVSGTITGSFNINRNDITIAGQTAPGDGICIKGSLSTNASNIIIRYIRVRWDPAMGESDAFGGRFQKNIIFDHVSVSWSTDETLSLYFNENTTVQWCIISQACPKGTTNEHRFGGIWGNNYGTWHHNLIAHNASRNPRWASGCGNNDYRNNVVYNWGYNSCYGGEQHQPGDAAHAFTNINMVANYYKSGPATGPKSRIAQPSRRDVITDYGKWYIADNFVVGYPTVTADNWSGVNPDGGSGDIQYLKLDEPWPAMAINQQTAEKAYELVLADVGCSLPNRDSVDANIIDDVLHGIAKYGNHGIIDSPSDVGGWPVLNSLPAPPDFDHDGMPNDWELANGLDSTDAEDRNIVGPDGYTNLEIYLNSMITYPTDVKEIEGIVPAEYTLEQNFPNPFNPTTRIEFSIPNETHLLLEVFDVLGRRVATLIDENKNAGNYSVEFNASNLSSGMYFYRLNASGKILTNKMLLMK